MARSAQVITSSYSNITRPSNPFTQVNLAPNKTEGVTSYDNAELIQAMSQVYTYAQQERSKLMGMFDNRTMTAMFHDQDTFNKVQFVQKTEESPVTPLYVPSGGTRSYSLLQFHQGVQMTQAVAGMRRYTLIPKYQMELAKALGRLYDKGILWALTSSVLSKSSTAANTFSGVPTTSVVALPNSSKYVVGKVASSTATYEPLTLKVLDDITLLFENRSIPIGDIWFIGGPKLRRAIKNIKEFRDSDSTLGYHGGEHSSVLFWRDWKFCFMGPETVPDNDIIGRAKINATGGHPAASGGTQLPASGKDSFLAVDFSTLQWGTAPFASLMRNSERDDISYTTQFYTSVGFGGMRIDDNKVLAVDYKDPTV